MNYELAEPRPAATHVPTRLVTWALAASAANDFLQAGFVALERKAEELERV